MKNNNILFISYSDYNYDGRTRSLINIFSKLGNLHCFIRRANKSNKMIICDESYPNFIIKAIKYAKSMEKIDVLVLDNRKATIPGLIIKKLFKPKYIIQDCRELYIFKEVKTIPSKLGCVFEKIMSRKADIVICANKERAEIMQRIYSLKKKPIVYENLRQLEYESDEALTLAKTKLQKYIRDDEVKIISSSGCSIQRTNDVLVKNLSKVKSKCHLFLVGSYTQAEKRIIQSIAKDNKRDEITILGQLNQTELKYLISKCDIGIVNYGQYDTNNKYCASGKIYEFLYEGLPVVTTTNPPLCRICNKFTIGMADDDYADAINAIVESEIMFRKNIECYITMHKISDNDNELLMTIEEIIGKVR